MLPFLTIYEIFIISPSFYLQILSILQSVNQIPKFFTGEYAVRFIPRENGPHLVYVSFDGCQIPDSPFRIQVGTIYADPGMVQAYGEGLKTGKTGKQSASTR